MGDRKLLFCVEVSGREGDASGDCGCGAEGSENKMLPRLGFGAVVVDEPGVRKPKMFEGAPRESAASWGKVGLCRGAGGVLEDMGTMGVMEGGAVPGS